MVASPFAPVVRGRGAGLGAVFPASATGRRGARRQQAGQPAAGEAAQLVGGDEAFLVGLVAEAGADRGQRVVQPLGLGAAVEAQDEGVAEAALVRGVRGPQRRPLGGPCGRGQGGRLVAQRAGDGAGGEVVAGLVGGGEQRVEVGVRAVGGEPAGPVAVVEAAQERAFGVRGGRGIEGGETGAAGGAGGARCGCGQGGLPGAWLACRARGGVPGAATVEQRCVTLVAGTERSGRIGRVFTRTRRFIGVSRQES